MVQLQLLLGSLLLLSHQHRLRLFCCCFCCCRCIRDIDPSVPLQQNKRRDPSHHHHDDDNDDDDNDDDDDNNHRDNDERDGDEGDTTISSESGVRGAPQQSPAGPAHRLSKTASSETIRGSMDNGIAHLDASPSVHAGGVATTTNSNSSTALLRPGDVVRRDVSSGGSGGNDESHGGVVMRRSSPRAGPRGTRVEAALEEFERKRMSSCSDSGSHSPPAEPRRRSLSNTMSTRERLNIYLQNSERSSSSSSAGMSAATVANSSTAAAAVAVTTTATATAAATPASGKIASNNNNNNSSHKQHSSATASGQHPLVREVHVEDADKSSAADNNTDNNNSSNSNNSSSSSKSDSRGQGDGRNSVSVQHMGAGQRRTASTHGAHSSMAPALSPLNERRGVATADAAEVNGDIGRSEEDEDGGIPSKEEMEEVLSNVAVSITGVSAQTRRRVGSVVVSAKRSLEEASSAFRRRSRSQAMTRADEALTHALDAVATLTRLVVGAASQVRSLSACVRVCWCLCVNVSTLVSLSLCGLCFVSLLVCVWCVWCCALCS